jgi:hypothetical protein
MSRVGVAVLCVCLLLFVVSGTLLSTAAGLPKFAIIGQEAEKPTSPGDGIGSYYGTDGWSGVEVGAFSALYLDEGNTYWSYIDDSCSVMWEAGFDDGLFRESESACTRFKVFRSLLITAIVFDFLIALALYTAILLRWLTPSATDGASVVPYLGLALSLCCLVPVAANVASMSLMVELVFSSFVGATTYGVSFRLMTAAFPLSAIAGALLAVDCAYHHCERARSSNQFAVPADITVTRSSEAESANEEGVAMAAIKVKPAELTGIQTAN